MTAIDHLLASDTLQFPAIRYHARSTLGEYDSQTAAFCVAKQPGQLGFDMPFRAVGIPFDGAVTVTAEVSGNRVTWTIDAPLDRWAFGFHVNRIRGRLVMRAVEMTPALGVSCTNEQRVFQAGLVSVPEESSLSLDITLAFAEISMVRIDTVTGGEVLAPVSFDVDIHVDRGRQTSCGVRYYALGTTVRLTALVSNVHAVGNPRPPEYAWSAATNCTFVGPTNGQSVEILLDHPGSASVAVTATVGTDLGQSGPRSRGVTLTVLTPEEAALRERLCELGTVMGSVHTVAVVGIGPGFTVGDLRFIDPLWDPTPEAARAAKATVQRRLASIEVSRIQMAANALAESARVVEKYAAEVLAVRRQNEKWKENGPGISLKKPS